jgi:uncharacterized OB-fold protein
MMGFPIIDRAFPADPSDLEPALDADNQPFWGALARGEMVVQGCAACQRLRFPVAPVCPHCGATECTWRSLSGRGEVFSWVRYHRSFLPEFEDLVPYVVIVAQLEEGVRMIGRLLERDVPVTHGQPITTMIERWPGGRCVPVFSIAKP